MPRSPSAHDAQYFKKHACGALLQGTRCFFQKSRTKSPIRAFHSRFPPWERSTERERTHEAAQWHSEVKATRLSHERLLLRSKSASHVVHCMLPFYKILHKSETSTFHPRPPKAYPNGKALLITCGSLQKVANGCGHVTRTALYSHDSNENPSVFTFSTASSGPSTHRVCLALLCFNPNLDVNVMSAKPHPRSLTRTGLTLSRHDRGSVGATT